MQKLFIFSFVFLFLSGCSTFQNKRATRKRSLPVKDVNYYARSSPDAPLRQRILVLPFLEENVSRSDKITKVARNTVVKQLSGTGQFVVVNNNYFPHHLKQFVKAEQ